MRSGELEDRLYLHIALGSPLWRTFNAITSNPLRDILAGLLYAATVSPVSFDVSAKLNRIPDFRGIRDGLRAAYRSPARYTPLPLDLPAGYRDPL